MSEPRPARLRRIFHEALDRRPDQRGGYLDSACAGDASLRGEVESLLTALAHAEADAFIEGDASAELEVEGAPREAASLSGCLSVGEGGRYALLHELGRGGMGVVLQARDWRLGRMVALKFLHSAEAADAQTRERFEREARSASAVNHPRLCTIYEVGEDDGQPFLVMELLEGKTLAARLGAGPLPLPELLDVASQMAEGVEAIHEAGIVHRDLKPANVFLTPMGVKILDFGLAKVGRAVESAGKGFQTEPGTMFGTVAYMAPEQARGEELDTRADIFAYGAVLYEMATGRPAFGRGNAALTFDAVLNREPPSLDPSIPAALAAVIARALAKDPRERYPSMAGLRADLRRVQGSGEVAPSPRATPRRRRGWLLGAGAVALAGLAAVLAVGRLRPPPPPDIDSVAVLPFESVPRDPDGASLAAGVTDSLVDSLSALPGVRVAPRSAAARYRGQGDLARAARELGVRTVVTGGVEQQGATFLIHAELIDLPREAVLWGGRYQRQLTDIFEVEEEVARAISERLRPQLRPAALPRIGTRTTPVPEAYRLYLRGRQEWEGRTDEAVRRAIAFYEAAQATDPSYAMPYAGLADAYLASRQEPPLRTRPRAKAAAEKALALDASLAEAHTSLAMIHFVFDWDWAAAETGFQRALSLDPHHATAHHWYGLYLMAMGRSTAARRELDRAREIDPFSAVIHTNLARNEFFAGNDGAAEAWLDSALEANRTFFLAFGFLSQVRVHQGRLADAVAAAERASERDDSPEAASWRACALAHAGRAASARRIALDLEKAGRQHHVDGYRVALVYAALGDRDRAFAWLDTAFAERSPWLPYLPRDPALGGLRGDSRFDRLRERLRLPPPSPPSPDHLPPPS